LDRDDTEQRVTVSFLMFRFLLGLEC